MKLRPLSGLFVILLLLASVTVLAQDESDPPPEATAEVTPEVTQEASDDLIETCAVLVSNALDLTQNSCDGTGTNQACYGYIFIDSDLADPQAQFDNSGDIVDVGLIESLQLSPLDTDTGQWGVATIFVEPNVDNATITDDDVQLVLYGETTLANAYEFVQVTANEALTIYEFPDENTTIVGTLETEETIITNARLEGDEWLRVRVRAEDGMGQLGWLRADAITPTQPLDVLSPISSADALSPPDDLAATYGPMQAIVFESGENNSPCQEVSNNGLLIQTPDGVASVTILLDEVIIQLDGTGVVTAQADGNLTVGVLDGSAQVTAEDETRTVVTGQAVDVALDANLSPESVPSDPRPLTDNEVVVPVVLLDDEVTLPDVSNVDTDTPISGSWDFSFNSPPPYQCSDGSEIPIDSAGLPASISIGADTINFSGITFTETSDGVYYASYLLNDNLTQDTLQVVSSDRITGERVIDFTTCTLTLDFTLQLISP